MDTYIHIRSPKFPILPGEKKEIVNEGMYGKAVAEYLQKALTVRGYEVPFTCAEDWGWLVEIKGAPFAFGVCVYCDPQNEALLDFFCTENVDSGKKWSWKKFGFVDTTPWVEKLRADMISIFSSDPDVEVLATDLEEPFVEGSGEGDGD